MKRAKMKPFKSYRGWAHVDKTTGSIICVDAGPWKTYLRHECRYVRVLITEIPKKRKAKR